MHNGPPLRIAMVSEHYYPHAGGVSEHIHNLSRELSARGHHVSIVTGKFPQEGKEVPPLPRGVEHVHVGRENVSLIFNGSVSRVTVGLGTRRQLRDLFHRGRFDVIHVHAPLFPMLPMMAVQNAPPEAAVLGTLHSVFDRSLLLRIFRPYLQRYLDALDGILSVSDSILPAHQRVGLDYEGEVVPNGIDLAFWRGGRRRPELDDGRINILILTRLEPRNQVATALEAFKLVHARAPRARLVIVGDGLMRPQLEAMVPPAMRDSVVWAGQRIADRNDYAASSHVYCFTANIASHPVSLIEGMAAGLPVVCHDIEGNRKVVDDGVEGQLVPLDDPRRYADAILRLVGDEALRRRMGEAAQRRAQAYGWERVADRIEAKYRELLRVRKAS